MGRVLVKEGTAASAVGTDIMGDSEVGKREAIRSIPRLIRKVAVTGSAAAGDGAVIVKVGGTDVSGGDVYNVRTGLIVADLADWVEINAFVPAGEPIQVVISDAGATNILACHMDIVDLASM